MTTDSKVDFAELNDGDQRVLDGKDEECQKLLQHLKSFLKDTEHVEGKANRAAAVETLYDFFCDKKEILWRPQLRALYTSVLAKLCELAEDYPPFLPKAKDYMRILFLDPAILESVKKLSERRTNVYTLKCQISELMKK